ncbi:hypothetical protein KVT40_006994 [Elsinoe batatas]|uniref:Amino acid permease/ SLC12A domain-containing protein n=1 Tax=Elsinoe batatas TaxID=2601811 RepID=A0A8K0PFG7_9PEZI|nr:hypothetical protein KVT40_006994 [Elsinoe batatas]
MSLPRTSMEDEKVFKQGVQEPSDHEDHNFGESEDINGLHRSLGNRQIQLIAIGGTIGTALFISIGFGLIEGGPGSLLIAFTMYSLFLATVNNSMAEMAIFMPVSGGWIRMASKWVDEAFGFTLGWNFFLYQGFLIPWEIAALNLVLTFWRDDIPIGAVCAACIVLYGILNLVAVRYYGESEFWLASGKVLLILIVFCFTFVTMVGGNPKHDAYGFRYWRSPGAFAEYISTGSLGRFQGYLGALFQAAFTIVGPEYLSMVAGEVKHPRKNLKAAFKATYIRYALFFVGGALCVGIVVPYDDANLIAKLNGDGSGTGAASPYVIAMTNLGVDVLPHITNALLVTAIFSAGNSYVYCASRTLYAMAIDGHAPKVFGTCTRNGIPIYALGVTMLFPLLSFLQVHSGTAAVITWLANLTEAAQLIDYIGMSVVYLFFYRALKAQGISRDTLPYKGWMQPFCGWFGLASMVWTVGMYGYTTFLPGWWSTGTFFSYYAMVLVSPVLYFGWKLVKRTKIVKAHEADLVWERYAIDAYEATLDPSAPGFWRSCREAVSFQKGRKAA